MTDAWVFLSIGDAGGCVDWVDLPALIATADAMNHDIPSSAELEGSVSRLIAAGFAEIQGQRTRLTPRGCETYAASNRPGLALYDRLVHLDAIWTTRRFPAPAPVTWVLGPEVVEAAYRAYRAGATK